ncbi:His-Xaa-Ser system radical SAM maturase HxsB [Variovorax sp. LjRoot178]|uniref:His-Xaa-Ser system radical SAM maturase HxsB n=1 Tax=Variovorax sp. LjRoot178 TaxID=3342277 RepID=UPI003ECC42B3
MSKFQPIAFYDRNARSAAADGIAPYQLMPFKFTELDEQRFVLTNLAGEYLVLPKNDVYEFANHRLAASTEAYVDLRSYQFLTDAHTSVASDLLALKLRTRYARLADFTGLHIFVVTLRCEHSCPYCQVSRQSQDSGAFDMTEEEANAAIGLALRSPAEAIKIEFQGGEPLLNFPLIKHIVHEAKFRNAGRKSIGFVIATNLAIVSDEVLDFCRDHEVHISTSLDGPKELHNKNRPRPGRDSYERVIDGIQRARDALGKTNVSALMTTTEASLTQVEAIIDEYLSHDFKGIFLRPLSPYGFAIKTKSYRAYGVERWLEFYKKGLQYIIELNRRGIEFREFYAATVLKKMLTFDDPGYVDLMSPAGIAVGAIVYNYDGAVFASDEARMLAEMGDSKFRLGNVLENSYEEIFLHETLLSALEESFSQSAPMCADCAYEPYCGADPVQHWGLHKDFVGRKPESEFCTRNMAIFKHLISLMESDPYVKRLFTSWAQ